MARVLLTGSNGFVGAAVLQALAPRGFNDVRWVTRGQSKDAQAFAVRGEWAEADFGPALEGVSAVVHLAARVHVMQDAALDPLAEFRRVNVQGTLNLARQAAAAGVRRFVFVSSVKVNGEATQPGQHFGADDAPAPQDAYGISKMEAEQGLRALAKQTGMEVVIIRPPLVYGSGVKGNFAAMVRWLQRGVPLPLGAVHNRRSLVALDNLVDLVVTCLTHPAAVNQTFMVSDGEDVSTTELLRRMGNALGHPARLLPVPVGLMRSAARLLGKAAVAERLFGSLQVDIAKTRELLGWTPVVTLDEGLRRVVEDLHV